jgi:hypothetical protein
MKTQLFVQNCYWNAHLHTFRLSYPVATHYDFSRKNVCAAHLGKKHSELRKGKKEKGAPALNSLSTKLWVHMGEWRFSSIILVLGTRWRWVVSFTPLPGERSPRNPLDMRLGGPQSRSGRCGEVNKKTNLFPSAGNRTPAIVPVARRCTDWAVATSAA